MGFNRLRQLGILGMNQRNAEYTLLVNPRRFYPLVDDKLRTKQLALERGIRVPELYGVIQYHHQIREVVQAVSKHGQFVVKPSMGSGGAGILVIVRHEGAAFEKASGEVVLLEDLVYYISGIVSGLYSLGGQDDKAILEYKVEADPVFEHVAYSGVPDIRVIVYRGVPVMSMVRLPTRESDGKANLHQGALGVGVSMGEGTTLLGVHHNRIVACHPDTQKSIEGIRIPYWEDILRMATLSYELTGLGYVGVDVVIDRGKGPMVLELNARPGLSIQIANGEGLLPRLALVDGEKPELLSVDERIHLGRRIAGV